MSVPDTTTCPICYCIINAEFMFKHIEYHQEFDPGRLLGAGMSKQYSDYIREKNKRMKSICAQCKKEYKDKELDIIAIGERIFFACPECIEQLSKK